MDWRKWEEFTVQFGLKGDRYLESFSTLGKLAIIGAFAAFVRKALYSSSRSSQVAANTVRRTLGNISQGFQLAGKSDPRLDVDGKISFRITQILKGFEMEDPNRKKQKALPMCVLKEMLRRAKRSGDDFDLAIAHRACGAYPFAMRSCEFTKTCFNEKSKRTKILRVRNFRFFLNRRLLEHSDEKIFVADLVNITYEWQKNEERHDSVSMHRCYNENHQSEFNPVYIWAKIVTEVRSFHGQDDVEDRKINTFVVNGKRRDVTSAPVRAKLRAAAASVGKETLGFDPEEIGCHSLRSGAAMAMKLAGVSEYTIMIIGRWKSMAFLEYIRNQVAEFSINISDRLLDHADFFTTPDASPPSLSAPSVSKEIVGGVNDWSTFKAVRLE